MHRVFNCGIGLVLAVAPEQAERALALLRAAGEDATLIGNVVPRAEGAPAAVVAAQA
jgi:phosphoribosylformylglycinamidine cyclo-ligase